MDVKFGICESGVKLPEPSRVEVREQLGEMITYTVVFAEDVCEGDFKLLNHSSFMPCKEIEIWVEVDDKKVFLVKGPIKSQQIKLVNGGQGSEVQVKGSDSAIKMKLVEKKHKHTHKDAELISGILASYGWDQNHQNITDHGLENDESKHSRLQNQDDLSFIKSIARENGLFFWINYNEDNEEMANFCELPLEKCPSAILIINGDEETVNNIDDLSINWDTDVPTKVVGKQMETKKKGNVDMAVESSDQHKLGAVTLKQLTKGCRQEAKGTHRPADDSGRAQQRSKGALYEAEWFIKANCSTSFERMCKTSKAKMGKIIHAHTTVKIEGAGSRHSGKYVVSGVTHTIDASSYKMQLELMRNAWDKVKTENGKQGSGS